MKEFALIFRMDVISTEAQPTEEQMSIYMEQWMEWINWIAGQARLSAGGNHFTPAGKVLRGNDISDGPYVCGKESVAGYILVLAENMDEAVKLAKKCPILTGEGTSVEIRETATPLNIQEIERS